MKILKACLRKTIQGSIKKPEKCDILETTGRKYFRKEQVTNCIKCCWEYKRMRTQHASLI